MIKLNPYLTFPGTAAQAIELYKRVFKVEPTTVQKFKDMPPPARAEHLSAVPTPQVDAGGQESMPAPSVAGGPPAATAMAAQAGERIIHAGFQIGNDVLMISDAPEGKDDTVIMGTQTHISLHPDSKEESDRMFGLLSEGGKIVMPMALQFWGDYFGMCKDRFGIHWMVNYHEEK